MSAIDDACVLAFCGRFPLVTPNRFETLGSTFKSNSKATDTGKQLYHFYIISLQFGVDFVKQSEFSYPLMNSVRISCDWFA